MNGKLIWQYFNVISGINWDVIGGCSLLSFRTSNDTISFCSLKSFKPIIVQFRCILGACRTKYRANTVLRLSTRQHSTARRLFDKLFWTIIRHYLFWTTVLSSSQPLARIPDSIIKIVVFPVNVCYFGTFPFLLTWARPRHGWLRHYSAHGTYSEEYSVRVCARAIWPYRQQVFSRTSEWHT